MPRRSAASKSKAAPAAKAIEYPEGCRELSSDMNAKELIEGLNVSDRSISYQ